MPTWIEWLRCGDRLPRDKCAEYRRLWQALDDAEQRAFIARPADVPQFPAPVGRITRVKLPPIAVDFSASSAGLGDSVAKLVTVTRLKEPAVRLAKWFFKVNDCGCRARQDRWNQRYPWPAWWRISVGTWLKAWV